MRNREFYEGQLRLLESLDSSPEHIRQVAEQIKVLEDKAKQAKESGEKGAGLNNAEKRRLKELKTERSMLERKEELEVLLNMNGLEEFTQEAEQEQAQTEALEMVDQMIGSDAERAANEAKGATTLEEGRSLTGKTAQREGVKGYYETEVPTQLTKRGDIKAEKAQMSKNSMLGASMQLATLNKLLTRTGLSEAQVSMVNKLIKYFNRVLDTLDAVDRQFEESTRAAENIEREAGVEPPTNAEPQAEVGDNVERSAPEAEITEEGVPAPEVAEEGRTAGTPEAVEEEKPEPQEEKPEEIDYDNLTEEQKRQFQIQGARANLDNIVKQLRELDAQKDEAKKKLEEAERNGDESGIRDAQFAVSRINMQMTPLRNQAQELVARINELEGRGEQGSTEQTQEAGQTEPEKERETAEDAEPEAPAAKAPETEEKVGEIGNVEQGEPTIQGAPVPPQAIEHVSGLKALLAAFIRILQAITRKPNLLEGARQSLVTIEYLPAGTKIDPSKVTKTNVTKENVQEVAEELGEDKEQAQQAAEEVDKAEETRENETGEERESVEEQEMPEVADDSTPEFLDEEPEKETPEADKDSRPSWELSPEQKEKINADSAEIVHEMQENAERTQPGKTEQDMGQEK